MFKSFIAWLDSYISHEEPSAVLRALVGLMAFAGLLGTIFGNQAIRTGAFAVVIMFAMSAMLLLLADHRRLRRTHETHRMLLARYCDFVIDHGPEPLVTIESWLQKVYVHPNGDVREVLTLKAVALRERVYFIRMRAGSGWHQPEKYRRNVRVTARSLGTNGQSGPRWHVTTSWQTAEKMNSILHLYHPIKRGEEVLFEVVRTWPAKCRPLISLGETEEFSFLTSSLIEIQHVEYSVVLPTGRDALYEPIGLTEPDVRLEVDIQRDKEGRRILSWRADKVPNCTRVGFRLELK